MLYGKGFLQYLYTWLQNGYWSLPTVAIKDQVISMLNLKKYFSKEDIEYDK